MRPNPALIFVALATILVTCCVAAEDDFPAFDKVSDGFTKVVSTTDGERPLYQLWVNSKTNQMLAELPRSFANQRHFFAMTVAGGDMWAGLQAGERYVYWKRYDKRLALIEPEVGTRTTGDQESRSSVSRHFTDRVILDVPIVTMGSGGGPVIDMDALLVGQANTFFQGQASGANTRLATIAKAKAFPGNVEVAFEIPVMGGRLKTFHYSISLIPDATGYSPRSADERIGYFTTTHRDLGKFDHDTKWVRYINRWHLTKADPSLKLSPPKEPIRFYIEHAVPVRYRRWIRDGILYWNKAFEQIGITSAIEVYYQDKSTGAHMDKDPEDVRYNFIRWLSNDIGTAIGPSRVHPLTGQILDADVVLTDGWIRHFNYQFHDLLPEIATQGMTPETLAWLDRNPQWDPRILLAPPDQRDFLIDQRQRRGVLPYGGHPIAAVDTGLIGDDEYDGLIGRVSQINGLCNAGQAKARGVALMRMHLDILANTLLDDDDDEDESDEPEGDMIDGIPDWFLGPMLADLVAHEVGHTLGLRHNFKASALFDLAEINSEPMKRATPFAASVMDYNPVNINFQGGEVQGDYAMIDVGPYDFWAIEYGYTFDDHTAVLARVAEPELQYGTDEDTFGPDPLARRYDFSSEPLEYANNQMALVTMYRDELLSRFVNDGDSWARARQGYMTTLNEQMSMISMMANWVGGAFVYRDHKADPNGRPPIEVVDPARQRAALDFVIEHSFHDAAFGLTPEMLQYLTVQKWSDAGGGLSAFQDATWPVHDRVMAMQSSAMTMILNPTTLRRVYDNEFYTPAEQDALTVPELIEQVVSTAFSELANAPVQEYTNRSPMISSLRRNLQSEVVDRLVRFAGDAGGLPRPVQTLAQMHLNKLKQQIENITRRGQNPVDEYTRAHLLDLADRIDRALETIQITGEVTQTFSLF